MNISVKVKANSKENKIEKVNPAPRAKGRGFTRCGVKDNAFVLWVKQAAKEGRANEAAVKLLSEFFDIPKSRITIISGHKSRNKVISLD